jgi:cell division protein FtsZ
LFEVNQAISMVRQAAHEEANILFGAVINDSIRNGMKVTVIATGFERAATAEVAPPVTANNVRPISIGQAAVGGPASPAESVKPPSSYDVPAFIRKKTAD